MSLIGIDIGTTGAKTVVMDERGEVLAAAMQEYPLSMPRPLWSEQDPRAWWDAAAASMREALRLARIDRTSIHALGLSGQMHGLVLLDAAGEPVRPCILWNDQRAAIESGEIHRRIPMETMIAITGKPALANFTAPKLLWVRKHEPDVFSRAAHLLLPKDYVRFRMTGLLASDAADASGTSIFDVGKRAWSDELVESLDLPRAWLPEVHESPTICGQLSASAAADIGLVEGTPVVAGAGDQAAEAVGLGIVKSGDVSVTVGTSGVVFVSFDAFRSDPTGRLHAYCHAVPGRWHLMGVMLSAGGSFRWYRDALCESETALAAKRGEVAYDLLAGGATTVSAGCEGLYFLPYLAGERTPHADPYARGAFVGLTLRHTRAHMTRAVLEGVAFGLLDSLDLVRGLRNGAGSGGPAPERARRVRLSGGGSRSAVWRQIMADVFNATVVTVNSSQGAAFGAAILAGVGAGVFPSVDDACREIVRETGETGPGPDAAEYPAHFGRYRSLYNSLRDEFRLITELESQPRPR